MGRSAAQRPPDAAHLPERFGLFTLILLGESVVAVMQGMESQENWPPEAALSAMLGMGVPFLICWWYFDRAAGREQRVRTERDAIRLHVWSYAHLPLYLGIVIVGVGIQRIVTAASHYTVSSHERAILALAATALVIAMTTISRTTGPQLRAASLVAQASRPAGGQSRSPKALRYRTDRDPEVFA